MPTENRNAQVNLKGHYVVFRDKIQTQNCKIYSIHEVIIQIQPYFFFSWLNKQAVFRGI